METGKPRGPIAEALGGTARQRGVKLGIIAGCITIFLLFGASALQRGSSDVVNLASGQIMSLVMLVLPGFLAVVIAAVLAYYAGLSTPEAHSGTGSREGLIAGSIVMLLFWVGQTLFFLVDDMRSPQGLAIGSFLGQRLLAALLFFVIGGMLGWGGSSAAARRARSILAPPGSVSLNLMDAGFDKPDPTSQSAQPAAHTPASGSEASDQGNALPQWEATADTPETPEQEQTW
jgi:hypothetical protein